MTDYEIDACQCLLIENNLVNTVESDDDSDEDVQDTILGRHCR